MAPERLSSARAKASATSASGRWWVVSADSSSRQRPVSARGGGELGLAVAAAVAERPDDRSLLHHQALQVDEARLAEGAEHHDPAAAARPPARRR